MNYTITDLRTREAPYNWFMIQAWDLKGSQTIRQLQLEIEDKAIQIIYSLNTKYDKRHVTLHNMQNMKTYHTTLKDTEINKNETLLEELKLTKTLEELIKKVI